MRNIPLRERKPQKRVEEDPQVRNATLSALPIPDGTKEFKAGYRECLQMFALHTPDKRNVARILERHCIILEDTCMASMSRENVAQYEGYRQAVKDLKKMKRIK